MAFEPVQIICPNCKKQNLFIKMDCRQKDNKIHFARECNFCSTVIHLIVESDNMEIKAKGEETNG